MARPKKPARERLQVVLSREQARRLRVFAKEHDRDISQVMRSAVEVYLDKAQEIAAPVVELSRIS